MLLFQKRFHEGLKSGAITLTVRRWDKPRVKIGGRYRCHPIGVIEVRGLERTRLGALGPGDAERAGFASKEELMAYVASAGGDAIGDDTEVYRVELVHDGDGDRVPIALDDAITPEDASALFDKLERLDGDAPWTRETLRLIARHPRVAASKLAAKVGRETAELKIDVRKLKKLGLTQSFEVGYELSPRGEKLMSMKRKKATGAEAPAKVARKAPAKAVVKTAAKAAGKVAAKAPAKPAAKAARKKNPGDPVAAYIAGQAPPISRALAKLRAIVQRLAPDATEAISYRIIGYKLDGRVLIYLAGFTAHYSIYPATEGVKAALGDAYAEHAHGAGTLRFDAARPVPVRLVEKIIRARVAEVREASAKPKPKVS